MAAEVLKVETQDSIEALQREAEELKKRLEEEKAKLKDVDSNVRFYDFARKTMFFWAYLVRVRILFSCKN